MVQSNPLKTTSEKVKKKMENKTTNPFVTIQCAIVEETETSSDKEGNINFATPTQQSPSLKKQLLAAKKQL